MIILNQYDDNIYLRQLKTMKKSELNSKAKAEIKKTAKEIENGLIIKLKAITGKLGKGTDKLEKAIEKGSKKLAKKIVKELSFDLSAIAVTVTDQKIKIEPVADRKLEKKEAPQKQAPEKPKPSPARPAKTVGVPAPKTVQTKK